MYELLRRICGFLECMWIETLPSAMQSSILTFLSVEHGRFRTEDLQVLAQTLVAKPDLDFWVRRAAENLFFTVVGHTASAFPTADRGMEMDEYNALPKFLENCQRGSNSLFPWIPMAFKDAQVTASDLRESSKERHVSQNEEVPDEKTEYSRNAVPERNLCVPEVREPVGERNEESRYTADYGSEIQHATSCISDEAAGSGAATSTDVNIVDQEKIDSKLALLPQIYAQATSLREALLSFDSNSYSNVSIISDKMYTLCMIADSREVLSFIKPWEVDDEVTLQLVESLLKGQEGYSWSTDMLCSLILPKLLSLTQPASRILVTAVLQAGKVHQRATVDALLLPLMLYKKGLNVAVCEVLHRLIKDCLQAEHVSSFFQKLLCEEIQQQSVICLPCHKSELSQSLVWTEPVFTLFQNILNHPMSLTQEVLDLLVLSLDDVAEEFSKSLKFSNFLLCLVNKHASLLKHHKGYLQRVAERTGTFMTKSILAKLARF
ncbi:uncharacterized protein LOC131063020 isoform X2 [Cryptomeria japonica]|uniref:uncharacterized protein LOC131063020 isoform X2 n=1 Tax=Cryptomeria japonica TaxID=3369 RepID=UPI0027DA4CC9|nr:uncharacterized protein LOC131063020 isoform X2 [Cryptomeria japonica]